MAGKISKAMSSDDKFWRSLAGTVETAFYPSGMKGNLGKQIHLFRYIISYQQAKYIVDNYKGRTDEEKLINYNSKRENLELDIRRICKTASKSVLRF